LQTTYPDVNLIMDSLVKLSKKENTQIITLSNPPANTFNTKLLNQMTSILNKISKDKPFIITGQGHIFSAGLDLFHTSSMDKSTFLLFIDLFQNLLLKIIYHKGPTATVLNGHAVAGGFILACSTDYRFAMHSNYKYGLNEKKLGLTLPPIPQAILDTKLKHNNKKIFNSTKLLNIDDLIGIPNFIDCCTSPIGLAIKTLIQSSLNKQIMKNKINEQNRIKEFLTINKVKISDDFYKRWWSKKSIIARKKQMELLKR
jgi:hypothetical protein